jgi:hypothetical protein
MLTFRLCFGPRADADGVDAGWDTLRGKREFVQGAATRCDVLITRDVLAALFAGVVNSPGIR